MDSFQIAIIAGLSAPCLLGLNMHFQHRGLKKIDPIPASMVSVISTSMFFWALSPLFVDFSWLQHPAVIYFLIAGIAFPAMGQFLQFRAISYVGPALNSALGNFMPVFAAVPAILFLGETANLQMAIGFALMVGGLVFAALDGRRLKRTWPLWALLLPVAASAARGVVQPVVKVGLEDIPSAFFATMMMASVSAIVLSGITASTGKLPELRGAKAGIYWFIFVGVLNGLAILLINTGISHGDVSVVIPLVATVPLWTLFWGHFVFRTEALTMRKLLLAAVVVAGAILIVTR